MVSCKNQSENQVTPTVTEKQSAQIEKVVANTETVSNEASETTTLQTQKESFIKSLKSKTDLGSFFADNWTLMYHEDNRCDGSTDGQINNLSSSQIDQPIKLQVNNDGDGWACDKKEPKSFDLDFNLKSQVKNWDRFEIANYENQEEHIVIIVGAGESDYLKLHYDNSNLIVKLEYRSEDPG
ncbi:hypothetical protein C1H87_15440 [Flavivirga eckloniae]|uniref:Uncharacterized protein n=2 Tax=Flavivirga eckloniae TaxID=1803846 RepID=A0A2K9PSH8_9FLAO|nr:hypothetical protein C1H87_15440 [Flavivirga eckloniae]